MSHAPITEADLHAWADGQLPEARRAALEDFLATHPEAAERMRAYRAQNHALRSRFASAVDEPLPDALRRLAVRPTAKARWRVPLLRAAAALVLTLAGGVIGWLAHEGQPAAPPLAQAPASLPRQAAIAHAVFSPDVRRPVEVDAAHEDQLVAWLSKRLGTPLRPPRLAPQGFELIGGRLLPGASGPVAQFMYQDAGGQRLTLYVSTDHASTGDTGFRFADEGELKVFYWIDGRLGYALSAAIDKARLGRIATAVYDQLDEAGAVPRTAAESER